MKVGPLDRTPSWFAAMAIVACSCLITTAATAQDDKSSIKIPIVMEEATVRGKVAILETRREDRKVVEGLPVRVWSTKPPKEEDAKAKRSRKDSTNWERDQLLHETETDELGLFDLPQVAAGNFLMEVSEVQFRLTVIPQSTERAGQSEPKVLLILIPKEVVGK